MWRLCSTGRVSTPIKAFMTTRAFRAPTHSQRVLDLPMLHMTLRIRCTSATFANLGRGLAVPLRRLPQHSMAAPGIQALCACSTSARTCSARDAMSRRYGTGVRSDLHLTETFGQDLELAGQRSLKGYTLPRRWCHTQVGCSSRLRDGSWRFIDWRSRLGLAAMAQQRKDG